MCAKHLMGMTNANHRPQWKTNLKNKVVPWAVALFLWNVSEFKKQTRNQIPSRVPSFVRFNNLDDVLNLWDPSFKSHTRCDCTKDDFFLLYERWKKPLCFCVYRSRVLAVSNDWLTVLAKTMLSIIGMIGNNNVPNKSRVAVFLYQFTVPKNKVNWRCTFLSKKEKDKSFIHWKHSGVGSTFCCYGVQVVKRESKEWFESFLKIKGISFTNLGTIGRGPDPMDLQLCFAWRQVM